ncbi:GTPase [Pirellulaceae bacterium SH449]
MNSDRYCLLTSGVPAAIAVVEISGPGSCGWLDKHWVPVSILKQLSRELSGEQETSVPEGSRAPASSTLERSSKQSSIRAVAESIKVDSIRYGTFFSAGIDAVLQNHDGPESGESIVLCRTGADKFELHCHGGSAAAKSITHSLEQAGFAKGSFASDLGHLSDGTIEQQALHDLQQAISLETASVLVDQSRGCLSTALRGIVECLEAMDSLEAKNRLSELVSWGEFGLHLVRPWKVVLAGPPNSGKSSLLNAILGYQRAIVHEQAGTTRDLLAEQTSLEGWPVLIVDSAGVRQTSDFVEGAGIAASLDAVSSADCLLLLVSPDSGWQPEHDSIMKAFNGKRVLVAETKADIGSVDIAPTSPFPRVSTSVHDADSISHLLTTVASVLVPQAPSPGQAVPFRQLHVEKIRKALELIERKNLEEAAMQLRFLLS